MNDDAFYVDPFYDSVVLGVVVVGGGGGVGGIGIPHICHFFSTGTIFGSIFLHAKARKSYKNRFRDKTA